MFVWRRKVVRRVTPDPDHFSAAGSCLRALTDVSVFSVAASVCFSPGIASRLSARIYTAKARRPRLCAAPPSSMGNFLDTPITEKETEVGEDESKGFCYGCAHGDSGRAAPWGWPLPTPRTLTPHAAPLAQALRDARVALAHGGRSHPHAHPLSRATTFITLWDL